MPKGGSREGAGRPRGSRGKRTQASIAQAETLGPTPLEILLDSMHAARDEGERAEAVECAKAAAPYVHPRLAPTSPPAPVHERWTTTSYPIRNSPNWRKSIRSCSSSHRPAKRRPHDPARGEDAILARFRRAGSSGLRIELYSRSGAPASAPP